MGIMLSMALMPVWSGSLTGCRSAMPGATMSILRVSVEVIGRPAVERLAQGIHHAADDGVADGHFQQIGRCS